MKNSPMYATQVTLRQKGFNPGALDGWGGPDTAAAFSAFLKANGFEVTVRGSKSSLTVTPVQPRLIKPNSEQPWMAEAFSMMGLHEKTDNAALREWLRSDGGTVGDPALIPWCGDFVHTAIRLGLPGEPITGRVRENPYLAMNWTGFGAPIRPCRGAIMSFWRGSSKSIYGHVGFYYGEDDKHYFILGGNQSNAVTITKIKKNRLRDNGSRWPVTSPAPAGGPVYMDMDVALSVNEA